MQMTENQKLRCPECQSSKVAVTEETMWMVNTGDHYCHSIKAHDSDAKVTCLKCKWEGQRHQLTTKAKDAK